MLVALDYVDAGSNLGRCIKLEIFLPLFGG
jgi:hypothetical protein